jgi:hypothetical protein
MPKQNSDIVCFKGGQWLVMTTESETQGPEQNPVISGHSISTERSAHCEKCKADAGKADATPYPFVYAVGRVRQSFPDPSTQKEFAQAAARIKTTRLTDKQVVHAVLSAKENRYLARASKWILNVGGIDTYALLPRDGHDLEHLIETQQPLRAQGDIDVVVGLLGPAVPGGSALPLLAYDQIYRISRDELLKTLPRPAKSDAAAFDAAASELLDRIIQIADNTGATHEHRALNYLAFRYPAIYVATVERYARNASLNSVDVRPVPLSANRHVFDVVFCYVDRSSDVHENLAVRVDTTGEFPFLVSKLASYLERS